VSGITVGRQGDELIAVKRADPGDIRRRRAEADLLSRLDHPGVVRFVAFVDGDRAELRTSYVGTETWARTPPTADDSIIAGLAAVASTVADLHEFGTSHGALATDHVVVSRDRRPILCGLADAQPLDASAELDDLVGLAGIMRDLSTAAGDGLRAELDDIARRAASGELTAHDVREEIASLSTQSPAEAASRRRHRPATRVGLLFALALTLAGVVVGLGLASPGDPPPEQTTTTLVVRTRERATPSTRGPTAPTTRAATTSTTMATTTTVPPPGVELIHEGRRYGLGAPGDIVVIGDWDCDGIATPALLRLADRTVAVFDRWPEPEATLPASVASIAPGAIGLETVDNEGCHRLRVLETDGSHLFIPEA